MFPSPECQGAGEGHTERGAEQGQTGSVGGRLRDGGREGGDIQADSANQPR